MSNARIDSNHVQALAARQGLVLRGGFDVSDDDAVPALNSGQAAVSLLLFGQLGSGIWESFSHSAEYADGKTDPLDRWSRRVGLELASRLGGTALFPFDGPPWHPFGQWAQRAESIRPSPLGILMHPEYGLWHAYRFAIALPAALDDSCQLIPVVAPEAAHACERCVQKPCLQACPVKAFRDGRYDVAACAAFLRDTTEAPCHQRGCLARDACPEARTRSYISEHRQFHMRQFCLSLTRLRDD